MSEFLIFYDVITQILMKTVKCCSWATLGQVFQLLKFKYSDYQLTLPFRRHTLQISPLPYILY